MTRERKVMPLAVVSLLAAALAVWAGIRGGSQALAYGPRQLIDRWHQQKLSRDPVRWERANAQLIRAHAWNRDDADLLADLGHMASLRGTWEPLWSDAADAYRQDAIDYYWRALRARPSWGWAWARMAKELARSGRLSQGGLEALEKAMVLAPLEQSAQQEVISLGASIWPRLGEDQKQQLKRIMRYAVDGLLTREVVDAAIAYGLLDEVQPMLENEQQQRLLEQRLRAAKPGG